MMEETLERAMPKQGRADPRPRVVMIDNVGAWLSDGGVSQSSVVRFLHWILRLQERGATIVLFDAGLKNGGSGFLDQLSDVLIEVQKRSGKQPEINLRVQLSEKREGFEAVERCYDLHIQNRAGLRRGYSWEPAEAVAAKSAASEDQVRSWHEFYLSGKTLKQTAKHFGIGVDRLKAAFKPLGLHIRPHGRSGKQGLKPDWE
jgi:hypothetical protein